MDLNLIFNGNATLEDLFSLYGLGYEFVIEDGVITHVLQHSMDCLIA